MNCKTCAHWSPITEPDGHVHTCGSFMGKDRKVVVKNWCAVKSDATFEYSNCDKWTEKPGNQRGLW